MRSRTRPAKPARLGVPSLRPPSRRTARTTFSIDRISFRTVRRATRSERHSRDGRLLTWTCLCVRQIGFVTQLIAAMLPPSGWGPHRGSKRASTNPRNHAKPRHSTPFRDGL